MLVTVNLSVATSSVDQLRKSLEHVLSMRTRIQQEHVPEDAPIVRVIDDGLRSIQRTLNDNVRMYESHPKIITEHDPTYV